MNAVPVPGPPSVPKIPRLRILLPANISEPDIVKFGVTQKVTNLFKAALRGECCYFQYSETGNRPGAFDASPYKITLRRHHL